MTKQEAIQEQIDEIMDSFEFEKAHKIMEAMNWEWYEQGIPDIYLLRTEARKQLKNSVKVNGVSGSGGLTAHYTEGKSWVKLDLYFGLSSINDGTEYE